MKKKKYEIDTLLFGNSEQITKLCNAENISKAVGFICLAVGAIALALGDRLEDKWRDNVPGYYTLDKKEKTLFSGLKNKFDEDLRVQNTKI